MHDAVNRNLTTARSLQQSTSATTQSIDDKIQLLNSKLANAENLVSQLKQAVNLDENYGIQLDNPQASVPHSFDDIMVDVKKSSTLTEAVIFFTEDSNSSKSL